MKIRFIKPFRFIGNAPDDGSDSEVPVGHIVDLENDKSAQWLIDNGFAEEVKESGWWKPKHGEKYFYIGHDGVVYPCTWKNDELDNGRLELGLIFKTEKAGVYCRDYLKAVETVRHDEGFMKTDFQGSGYYMRLHFVDADEVIFDRVAYVRTLRYLGAFFFDTSEHAEASLEAHRSEWQTILNYDWSKE